MKTFFVIALVVTALGWPPRAAWSADGAPVATGDLHRSYVFASTGESVPYRLYVPPAYHGEKEYPLVVVLHGGGGTENGPMDNTGLQDVAAKHGYIVLSPLGYNRFGGYGNIYPVVVTSKTAAGSTDFAALSKSEHPGDPVLARPPPPAAAAKPEIAAADDYVEQPAGVLTDAHVGQLSEAEVLTAIAEVRKDYRIDAKRLYLMGNSAGGVGTLYLAAKYPDMWAAIAPQGGVIAAWSYPYWRLRDAHVATLFVHGELDEHCNPKWSRVMADSARADGADAAFLPVPGGTHGGAWKLALPQVFDFFDSHARHP